MNTGHAVRIVFVNTFPCKLKSIFSIACMESPLLRTAVHKRLILLLISGAQKRTFYTGIAKKSYMNTNFRDLVKIP